MASLVETERLWDKEQVLRENSSFSFGKIKSKTLCVWGGRRPKKKKKRIGGAGNAYVKLNETSGSVLG